MKPSILFLVAVSLIAPAAQGNVAFMPGDAFFHSDLTEAAVADTSGDETFRLKYSHVPLSGGLGGYAGFEWLEVTGDTTALRHHLKVLYESLRMDNPKEVRINHDGSVTELNGFHIFVYNADVKWDGGFASQGLGMKYNESWTDLPASAFQSETRTLGFGHAKGALLRDICQDSGRCCTRLGVQQEI